MKTLTIGVRRAEARDAEAITAVHDAAWRFAYEGMIPAKELARIIARRGPRWWDRAIRRGTAILVLLMDLLTPRRGWIIGTAVAGGLATAVCAIGISGRTSSTFCTGTACSWITSPLAGVVAVLFAALTVGVLALSVPSLRLGIAPVGEFCFLLTSSMAGGVVIAYAGCPLTIRSSRDRFAARLKW